MLIINRNGGRDRTRRRERYRARAQLFLPRSRTTNSARYRRLDRPPALQLQPVPGRPVAAHTACPPERRSLPKAAGFRVRPASPSPEADALAAWPCPSSTVTVAVTGPDVFTVHTAAGELPVAQADHSVRERVAIRISSARLHIKRAGNRSVRHARAGAGEGDADGWRRILRRRWWRRNWRRSRRDGRSWRVRAAGRACHSSSEQSRKQDAIHASHHFVSRNQKFIVQILLGLHMCPQSLHDAPPTSWPLPTAYCLRR